METKSKNGLEWREWERDGILMIELTGKGFFSEEEAERKFRAEFIDETSFEILVDRDCNVYSPPEETIFDMFSEPKSEEEDLSERLFLAFRKKVFPPPMVQGALEGLRGAARPSKNRGVAGGKVDPKKMNRDGAKLIPVGDGTRAKYITKDGIVSDTVEANITMGGIAGFYPASARNPYVRKTAYTRDNWDLFKKSWPLLQKSAEIFKGLNPRRFEATRRFIDQHDLDSRSWVIPGTPFSTITVNKNFQTACHQDSGDLKAGFENFSVLEGGTHTYKGGYTVFPRFRVAFDCRAGDWAGMDVAHHYHGNTPIESAVEGEDDWERISLVMYIREDLAGAGTQEEESEKFRKWKSNWKNPVEKHAFRKESHDKEVQKDEDFMSEFGG